MKTTQQPKAWLYKANGEVQEIAPKYGKKFTLEEMQAYVGGYVEQVGHTDKPADYFWGDEDGLPKQKPINDIVSGILGYTIVGDIVACPYKMFN